MKTNFLIVAGIMCVAAIPPASAVTKCVALNPSNTTWQSGSANGPDWDATCTTGGVNIAVRGISVCSSTEPSGSVAMQLELSSNPEENKYCWCKMTSPAVSRWVPYHDTYASAQKCFQDCSGFCTRYTVISDTMRGWFFSNLSD